MGLQSECTLYRDRESTQFPVLPSPLLLSPFEDLGFQTETLKNCQHVTCQQSQQVSQQSQHFTLQANIIQYTASSPVTGHWQWDHMSEEYSNYIQAPPCTWTVYVI